MMDVLSTLRYDSFSYDSRVRLLIRIHISTITLMETRMMPHYDQKCLLRLAAQIGVRQPFYLLLSIGRSDSSDTIR